MREESRHSVFLKGLRFHSPIGVMEQERVVGNDIIIDIRMDYPFQKAMESDDVYDTLNYASVYQVIKKEAARPVKLLRNLPGTSLRDC